MRWRGAKGFGGSDSIRIRVAYSGISSSRNRVQSIQPQCYQRRHDADAEKWNHEREQRDARNGLQHSECADRRLCEMSAALESKSKRNSDDHGSEEGEHDEH